MQKPILAILGLFFFLAVSGLAPHPHSSGYVNVDGLDIYYETAGAGAPLVLLPGGGSTVQVSFGRIGPLLGGSHRLIGIETQGEGHTRDRATPLSFERDADDVAGVLKQLGIPRADFLGFSNGGNVAIQVAIRHPHIVRRLILASAFIRRGALEPSLVSGLRNATPSSMPPALRTAYLEAAPDPSHLPVLVKKLTARVLQFHDTPSSEIRAIKSPTLLIFADHDVYRPEHFAEMLELFPDAKLAVFPNSTHGQYLGEASGTGPYPYVDACSSMILAFLQ